MRELGIGTGKARLLRELLAHEQGPPDTVGGSDSGQPDPQTASTPEQGGPADPNSDRPHETLTVGGPDGAATAAPTLADVAPDPVRAGSATGPASPPARARVGRPVRSWPVLVLAAPAWVAIWSGWVGLGELTGFGPVHPLPGVWDGLTINTAVTLPVGMEAYAAYALRAWLSSAAVPARARRFAMWSAIVALLLGAAGQIAYHLMTAAGLTAAPWPVTTLVSCLPVAVLGMGAALAHLLHTDHSGERDSR